MSVVVLFCLLHFAANLPLEVNECVKHLMAAWFQILHLPLSYMLLPVHACMPLPCQVAVCMNHPALRFAPCLARRITDIC